MKAILERRKQYLLNAISKTRDVSLRGAWLARIHEINLMLNALEGGNAYIKLMEEK